MPTPYARFIVSEPDGTIVQRFYSLEAAEEFCRLDYNLTITVVPMPDPTCYLGDDDDPRL